MNKQLIFSAMLGLCAFGSTAMYSVPAMAAVAQSPAIKVSGQVVDEQGEPLLGATIRVKNSSIGTTTDLDGNFQLEVPGNAVLLISYVGYKEREVAVRSRSVLGAVQLQSDDFMLDQVVVVGYGTQKKSDLTGSVAVVDTEALKQVSHSNISSMLEGKVAGVQLPLTVSQEQTRQYEFEVSVLLVILLLFMSLMVCLWVLLSAISLPMTLKLFRC